MNITLKLQDNPAASFGETYMGNPGVHLPWDVNRLSMGSRSLCDAQADVFGSCASVLQAISQGPGGAVAQRPPMSCPQLCRTPSA